MVFLAMIVLATVVSGPTFNIGIHESGVSIENGTASPIYTITVGSPEPNEEMLFKNLLLYFLPESENTDRWYSMHPLKPGAKTNPRIYHKALPAPFDALESGDLKNGKVLTLYYDGSMRFYFREGKMTLEEIENLIAKMGRKYNIGVQKKIKK